MNPSRTLLLIAVAGLLTCAATAPASLPEINSLKAPASPAFTILGVSPTAVERPMTPSAIGLTLLGKTNNLTELPRDLSMEVAPYWLSPHPDLSWEGDDTRSVADAMQRTLGISAATTESGGDTTALGLGIRASVLSGSYSERFKEQMRRLEEVLGDIATRITKYQMDHDLEDPSDALIAEWVREQETALEEFKDLEYERVGWMLDVALATVLTFPDNISRLGRNRGWAGWVTLSREWESASLVGVARYQDNDLAKSETFADIGVRSVWKGGSYSVSLEAVWRIPDEGETDTRVASLLEYEILKGTWISFTLGEDFETDQPDSFLAQLGINLNFDRNRRVQDQ